MTAGSSAFVSPRFWRSRSLDHASAKVYPTAAKNCSWILTSLVVAGDESLDTEDSVPCCAAVVDMTTSDPSPRVPAWKRIGLKLKYANETADALPEQAQPTTQRGPQPAVHQEEKPQRKRLIKDSALETPAKRSRPDDAHISTRTGPQKTTTNHPFHDPERSKFPAPTGVFKAPNQTPKRIVFGDDE